MASHPAWKKVEERIAKMFGTDRNPLSGGNGKITRSDTRHPTIFFDCKHGKTPVTHAAVVRMLTDISVKAGAEGKTPVLVTHHKHSNDMTCWMSFSALNHLRNGKEFFPVAVDAKELAKLMQ